MTILFAVPLAVGIVLMLTWIGATAAASSVDGWGDYDPEARVGPTGRFVVAFLIGFGMAGISALFAGWSDVLSIVAGLAGGAALIGASRWLGPVEDR
ncbi:MAG: hypothetical protein ACR2N7_11475 [Acidimicrobiia bacterium]